jgi:XTP/dITP diphosphohydrolase
VNLIHLATGNAHKAREFQALADAAELPLQIQPVARMPVVVEDTGTFVGNAGKKAAALKALLPPDAWVLADDSGLCVDALDGAPGVESAYYAGPAGDSAANLAKLVTAMRAVPVGRRGARFICVLVLLGPDGREIKVEGRCEGSLRNEPAGAGGFGYDPLFVPAGGDRCYAELTAAEKNSTSHRARAFRALIERLAGDPQGRVV